MEQEEDLGPKLDVAALGFKEDCIIIMDEQSNEPIFYFRDRDVQRVVNRIKSETNSSHYAEGFEAGRRDAMQELELAQQYPGDDQRHRGTSTATQLVFANHRVAVLEAELEKLRPEAVG